MAIRYPLEDLLRVRRLREEDRQNGVTQARQGVERAAQGVEDAKKRLAEYAAWRVEREAQLYAEVMHREIAVRDLDELKVKIQLLRDQELAHAQGVRDAEKALAAARDALAAARAAHAQAVKETRKIQEHREWWTAEALREAEMGQEKELEDFRTRDPDALGDEGDESPA